MDGDTGRWWRRGRRRGEVVVRSEWILWYQVLGVAMPLTYGAMAVTGLTEDHAGSVVALSVATAVLWPVLALYSTLLTFKVGPDGVRWRDRRLRSYRVPRGKVADLRPDPPARWNTAVMLETTDGRLLPTALQSVGDVRRVEKALRAAWNGPAAGVGSTPQPSVSSGP